MDEVIAKTLIAAGEEHFKRKVTITCANRQVKDMIDYVVTNRKAFFVCLGTPGAEFKLIKK